MLLNPVWKSNTCKIKFDITPQIEIITASTISSITFLKLKFEIRIFTSPEFPLNLNSHKGTPQVNYITYKL